MFMIPRVREYVWGACDAKMSIQYFTLRVSGGGGMAGRCFGERGKGEQRATESGVV